jgi:uncharacterized protein (UPF0264 family)
VGNYEPKTTGIPLLKKLVSCCNSNKNSKYITMSVEKAQSVIDEIEGRIKSYNPKNNSVRASALNLCIPPEELCERLNAKSPAEIKEEIKKIKVSANAMYERAVKDGTGLWLTDEFQNWNKQYGRK